jgi:hypothetical protein
MHHAFLRYRPFYGLAWKLIGIDIAYALAYAALQQCTSVWSY